MKIRIQSNTVRVRLNEREVSELQQGQSIVSQTWFPTGKLIISLHPDQENHADLQENQINITVSTAKVNHWASSDEVSIGMEFDTPDEEKLSILVEKDMKV